MSNSAGNWCLIESDPGVFTELIEGMGCKGVQVEELYALDDGLLNEMKPVYGLIFLFKYDRQEYEAASAAVVASAEDYNNNNSGGGGDDDTTGSFFFAHQVISNACATQAILSVLFNAPTEGPDAIELGSTLYDLLDFTRDFPPDMRGFAISNSDAIRTVHNSFARSDPFVNEQVSVHDEDEDLFHFVAYVPIGGRLYELDGLKPKPVDHGACTDADWLKVVAPVLQERMSRVAASATEADIRYNLMAVVRDKRRVLDAQIKEVESHLSAEDNGAILGELEHLRAMRANEDTKRERYHQENVLRRHNFIPFIYELGRQLALAGKMDGVLESARDKAKERRERELRQKQQQQQ
ncbi:ubiquitin carboxyl-terminal hydrolase isozyme L5 [Ramicandelaber brevisporus]|nr:ubiquitin carboxyl-terminal hydrolase isozyme L5 [Ramicandelaber brevisporus]